MPNLDTIKNNLPSRDSTAGRTLVTIFQAAIGFIAGLIAVVWDVPGVPEAVTEYVRNNLVQVLMTLGVPTIVGSGIVTYVMNYLRPSVPNWK